MLNKFLKNRLQEKENRLQREKYSEKKKEETEEEAINGVM